jgi:hypothetical protein
MRIELGNANPSDPQVGRRSVTLVTVPDSDSADEALRTIVDPSGVWAAHSVDPAPAWVEADNDAFAARLAAFYGVPVGRPADWEVSE